MKLLVSLCGLLLSAAAFAQGPVVRSFSFGPLALDSAAYTTGKIPCFGAKQVVLHVFCRNDSNGTQADSVSLDSLLYSVNDSLYTGNAFSGSWLGIKAQGVLASQSIDLSAGKYAAIPIYPGGLGLNEVTELLVPAVPARSMKVKVKPFASYYSLATGVTTIRRMKAFTIRAYVFY